ncbi:MAG: hydroxyacid dehydrogenase [Candidatus Heteroscillospira sp.]|jgi:D-3-phosphoglycerate dehydrogenase
MAKVYIPQYSGEAAKQYLLERGYELIEGNEKVCDPASLAVCDAIVSRALPLIREEDLALAPNLKVIGRYGVGVDNIDVEACTRHGVQVTNAPMSNYVSVAEHAWMFIMECAKNVTEVNELFRGEQHYFNARNTNSGCDLCGRTVGVLGLGRIGRRVAQYAAAFEMPVVAYDPFVPQEKAPAGVTMMSRDEVLRTADFVTLHLPAMAETYHSIGKAEFEMMKPSAYFINCARGSIVDEAALIEALQTKVIAGAGVDVYEIEPPAADNPLLYMSNVVCSPHLAGATRDANDRMGLHAAQGIHEVLSGQKPTWPVNKL